MIFNIYIITGKKHAVVESIITFTSSSNYKIQEIYYLKLVSVC